MGSACEREGAGGGREEDSRKAVANLRRDRRDADPFFSQIVAWDSHAARTMLAVLSFSSAYVLPAGAPARSTAAVARAAPSTMDETILQRALEGTLEEEGAEQHWLSEVGWADWQDKNGGASYNMNQRFSKADDGYVTPDVFSNPIDGAPLGPAAAAAALREGCGAAAGCGRRPPRRVHSR